MKIRITLFLLLLSASGYCQWMPLTHEFRVRNLNDSLRSKFLVTDFQGVVWIGSNQGLLQYSNENLSTIIEFPEIITCAAAIDSSIWLGGENGSIFKLNTATRTVNQTIMGADSSAISSIASSGDNIVVSTLGEGVYLLNGENKTQFSTDNLLSDNYIYEVNIKDDILICATDRGVDVIDISEKKQVKNFPSSITTSVSYLDSVIISASYKYGLVQLKMAATDQPITKSSLEVRVSKIKKYGNRLFALTDRGVDEIIQSDSIGTTSIINRSNIIDFVVLNEGILLALSENGTMLIADLRFSKSITETETKNTALTQNSTHLFTGGNGNVQIWDINSGTQERKILLEDSPVIVSMAASNSNLYVGTFNRGIYKLNFEKNTISKIDTAQGLPDNNVLSMSLRNDTLWFTTLSGVSCLLPTGIVKQYSTPTDATYIYSIFSSDSTILIGTDGNGLYELRGDNFLRMPFAHSLTDETIYHISEDGSKNLWFITKNQNLLQYNRELDQFSTLNLNPEGYVMATGGYGNSALAVGNGWLKYYVENRLITLENNPAFENLSGEYINNIKFDGHRNILFASGKTLYKFTSEYFDSYPRVVLQSFQTNLNERKLTATELDFDINHIAYTFEPVWYQNPENVKFRYRLIGIDEDWNYSSGNAAVYPNLNYGSYTFEVETGLENEYYPESALKHTFTIAKPYYKEWWFFILIILLIALIIYTSVRWQLGRMNRKWLSEKKLVESELAVLRNQVNPHFLFNSLNTLMNLIETKPKVAEEYLQRLSIFYRKILENQDDQVLSLKSEIENLEEYIYLQKQRFGEALILEIELDKNLAETKIPALTFQLLAENAIKHNVVSQSHPLVIRIYNEERQIVVKNIKAPLSNVSVGTGTGLENIQSRYKVLFKKPIEIIDDSTEFTIKLPIIPR